MGIIILPIYIGALIIYFFCGKQIMKWHANEALSISTILFGLLISLIILVGVGLSYYFKERVYAFSPVFRFPFVLFYIPGILALILLKSQNLQIENIAKSIVVSIIFSGVLMLIFHKYTFGILEFLEIEKYY